MSAFCCKRAFAIVTNDRPKFPAATITVRPTAAEKQLFAELAASRGISEARLALIAIRALIDSQPANPLISAAIRRSAATDRITIRLRPGDAESITRRAEQRRMKASTYLSALVRAHVAANPPLTTDELNTFKKTVMVLTGVGRCLAQVARNSNTGDGSRELREELNRTRVAIAALENRMSEFALAAIQSWESRYG